MEQRGLPSSVTRVEPQVFRYAWSQFSFHQVLANFAQKGVMISHRNVIANVRKCHRA